MRVGGLCARALARRQRHDLGLHDVIVGSAETSFLVRLSLTDTDPHRHANGHVDRHVGAHGHANPGRSRLSFCPRSRTRPRHRATHRHGNADPHANAIWRVGGLAIIGGDSTQDEYAAPRTTGRRSTGRTPWRLRLPLGSWAGGASCAATATPTTGRSGATSAQTLANQAPGAPRSCRRAIVSYVLIQVGINDFNGGLFAGIYAGQPVDYGALDTIASNIARRPAIGLRRWRPGRVIVAPPRTTSASDLIPRAGAQLLLDPAGVQRVIDAAAWLNARTHSYPSADVIWFDWNAAMRARAWRRSARATC